MFNKFLKREILHEFTYLHLNKLTTAIIKE